MNLFNVKGVWDGILPLFGNNKVLQVEVVLLVGFLLSLSTGEINRDPFPINELESVKLGSGYKNVSKKDGQTKIVGGTAALVGQFPYQAALLDSIGNLICGGSLISYRHVLTAAHCTDGKTSGDITVRLGSLQFAGGGQTFSVSRIFQHSGYTAGPPTWFNDVSVIQLSSRVTINRDVGVVKLAKSEPAVSTACTISGWGGTASGPESADLLFVDIPIFDRTSCGSLLAPVTITQDMICAGLVAGGMASCQGDSGGPLVLKEKNIQVGVVSFGAAACALPNSPVVYASVARYRSWIDQQTQLNFICRKWIKHCTGKSSWTNLYCIIISNICRLLS